MEPLRYNTPIVQPDGTPTEQFQRLWQQLPAPGGGGSGTVTSISFSSDFSASPNPVTTTGTVGLSNTGVVSGAYTNANVTVDAKGRITSISNGTVGTGTVTSVTAGTGLTGGTITSSGTIALANTAVTPGNYGGAANAVTFTVDAQGRLTAASQVAIAIAGTQVSGNIAGNAANVTGVVAVANGGTGVASAPSNGQLLIGNGTNYTLATLTAGAGMTVTNAAGSITVATGRLTAGATTSGTLVAGDAGDVVEATGNITIPNSVFSARDVVYIRNTTAGSITVSAGAGVTLRWVANTGTRTIAQYGFVSLLFVSASEAWVVGGAGVS